MVLELVLGRLNRRKYPLLSRAKEVHTNTVATYQKCFFSKLTFLSLLVLVSKCPALLIPIASSELGSDQLCPNPVDWHETYTSSFFRFFPNNVLVMELIREPNASSLVPCHFRIGGPKWGKAILLSLQQRATPLNFLQRCPRILEFPGRWGEDSQSLRCETEEEDDESELEKSFVTSEGQFNIRITQKRLVKWGTGGKIAFELPFQSMSAPFLVALFKVTTQAGGCELQLQQYFWSKGNDSWTCAKDLKRKLMSNVCGQIPCSKQHSVLQELKGIRVDDPLLIEAMDELEPPPGAKIRTLGYFLKGLLLPLLISISATMGYIIWRRRMKASAGGGLEGVSLGTQTGQPEPGSLLGDEEGVLIHFGEDEDGKDKPPTYDSLLEPPTYEEAMSPHPLLMELELEQELPLLQKSSDREDEDKLMGEGADPPPPFHV